MARASDEQGGATKLVAAKAVSPAYPLRGALQLKDGADAPVVTVTEAPAQGEAWVDAGLLDALNLQLGDKLLLGDAALRLTRIIVLEPDRGAGFMSFAPRVMFNEADLTATGLIQPASRVTYRLAVAAPPGRAVAAVEFVDWADARIKREALPGMRVESLDSGRPEMRQTIDRAEKFLNLVALLAALLAAVAVGIASREFANRHLDDCAMLRVLGQPQRAIALQYIAEFAAVGVLASVVGVAIGFAVHYVFIWLLAGLVGAALPAASAWPALFGIGVGLTLLFGFGLPPVLQLARVPPLRVIRRDVGALKPASAAVSAAGVLGFAALLLAVASDIKLGLIAVGGFAAAVALFAAASWIAVQVLKRAVPESRAPRWMVLATRQIAARPAFAVLQVSALSVGLLALVLLVLLRTDLISAWRRRRRRMRRTASSSTSSPSRARAFQAHLRARGRRALRLVPDDSRPARRRQRQAGDARRLHRGSRQAARRARVQSQHRRPIAEHNELVGGRWRTRRGRCVEHRGRASPRRSASSSATGCASTSRACRSKAASRACARSTGRRCASTSSSCSRTRICPTCRRPTSPRFVRRPPNGFDNALCRDFPNITNVDVSATLGQVQSVLDQVIRAIEFLFGFTLAAGLVVLFSAVRRRARRARASSR